MFLFYLFALSGDSAAPFDIHVLSHLFRIEKSAANTYFTHDTFTKVPQKVLWRKDRVAFARETLWSSKYAAWISVRYGICRWGKIILLAAIIRACTDQKYDVHHEKHCNAVLRWIGTHGRVLHLDLTTIGSTHDSELLINSDPLLLPTIYFIDEEIVIGETGFIGTGPVVCS